MGSLKELLVQRKLSYLLQKADEFSIEKPESISMEGWESVLSLAREKQSYDTSDRVEYYLELAGEEGSFWEVGEDECESQEEYSSLLEYRQRGRLLAENVLKADKERVLIAERIANKLLERSVMERFLLKAGDTAVGILKDISSRDRKSKNGRDDYDINLPWEDCPAVDDMEQCGYAVVHAAEAWQSDDDHRYVTGISIPEDVLALFRSMFTPEFDERRKNRYAVSESCYLAKMYYETAPIEIVMKIYRRYAEACALSHILTEQEFVEIAKDTEDSLYSVLEADGRIYIVDTFVMDNWDEVDSSEDSILFSDLENIRNCNQAFYIPPIDEIKEFFQYGWWPSREPWQRARAWFTDFYLDEKEIQGMFPRMLRQFVGDEEADFYRSGYNMDTVMDNVNEKISLAVWFFMSGNDVNDLLDEIGDVTAPVRPEAKESLISILEECLATTNKTWLLGHCNEKSLWDYQRQIHPL